MGLNTNFSWSDILEKLSAGESLSSRLAEEVMEQIVAGSAGDARIGAFLLGMRAKGETSAEIAGMVRAMLSAATRLSYPEPLLDTCGTGGDRQGTFNISTCAALICAGAGAKVAKHGNRSASSQCGSADVLEAMGVAIDLGPTGVVGCLDEAGIGFLYARRYHPAMANVASARSDLGIPTVMNFLGPLSNPAGARRHSLGVANPAYADVIAGAMARLETEHALVFHGADGLDELTITGTSRVIEVIGADIKEFAVSPEDVGVKQGTVEALRGGDAKENANIVKMVLEGEPGPYLEVSVLNAGAGLVAYGIARELSEGVEVAREAIASGSALAAAESLIRTSQKFAGKPDQSSSTSEA